MQPRPSAETSRPCRPSRRFGSDATAESYVRAAGAPGRSPSFRRRKTRSSKCPRAGPSQDVKVHDLPTSRIGVLPEPLLARAPRTTEARAVAVAPEPQSADREVSVSGEAGQREEAGSAALQDQDLDQHAGDDAANRQQTESERAGFESAHAPESEMACRKKSGRKPEDVESRLGFVGETMRRNPTQTWTRTGSTTIGMPSHCRRCWIIFGVSLCRSRWKNPSLRNTSCPVTIVALA